MDLLSEEQSLLPLESGYLNSVLPSILNCKGESVSQAVANILVSNWSEDAAMLSKRWQLGDVESQGITFIFPSRVFLINLQFMKLSMLSGVLPGSLCWLVSGEVKKCLP